ncbi:MAG: AmmeMemoRadiSam system protein B [Epsilonproteobacteria bacterium]|nr:MAG: AmmeMemoRadiSam system protein B [Campylobacterota bacterium]
MSERKLAVSGQFYPDNKDELERYINHFNDVLEQNNIVIDENLKARAIIVPHAGYVYSGFTANIAYKYIPKNAKNIIVIGPSHKYAFEGASVALYDEYPTPFGNLSINEQLSKELICNYEFLTFNDTVHCEHSTETQFPFIKNYKENIKVVEIVYSDIDFNRLANVIEELLEDKNNFVVISTDLSHFHDIKKANSLDNICLDAISNKSIDSLDKGCEACGMTGVKAMIEVSNKLNLDTKILDYRTSADTTNDQSSVVGYVSSIIY